MESSKALGAIIALVSLVFFAPLIGVLFGAFSGWVVGLFFADTVLGFLARIGIDVSGLNMWQVGAALGFLGAFFRSSHTSNSSK